MDRCFRCLLAALATLAAAPVPIVRATAAPPAAPAFIIVNGAAGEEAYADVFARQVTAWEKTATAAGARAIIIGREATPVPSDRTRLEQALADEPRDGTAPLWLVLIGHGTFDTRTARFNLRGEDLSAPDLAAWLQPIRRPLAVINTTSASAPFLNALSAPGRVIITATRSGNEQNYSRFGASLATALDNPETDLDQDGQISLLEAFLSAATKVTEFYQSEGRLATEHALIDDNGDTLGTPATWFRGLRATRKPNHAAAVDGPRAHQWLLTPDAAAADQSPEWLARRDSLETTLATLRDRKESMPEADYLQQLESTLLDLAHHYEAGPGLPDDPAPPSTPAPPMRQ
jgi:hypothetical protein